MRYKAMRKLFDKLFCSFSVLISIWNVYFFVYPSARELQAPYTIHTWMLWFYYDLWCIHIAYWPNVEIVYICRAVCFKVKMTLAKFYSKWNLSWRHWNFVCFSLTQLPECWPFSNGILSIAKSNQRIKVFINGKIFI